MTTDLERPVAIEGRPLANREAARTAPIVVIGRQRSGTTVFRELLVAAGAFDAGEIFHRDFMKDRRRFFAKILALAAENPIAIHPTEYPRIFRSFLGELRAMAGGRPAAIDIKYNALRIVDGGISEGVPAAIRIAAGEGARFVHLRRENLLRVQVSLAVAQATGRWRETEGQGSIPVSARRVRLDPAGTLQQVAADAALARSVSAWLTHLPHHTLTYETLFEPNGHFAAEALTVVAALLTPDFVAPTPAMRQQNPEPIAELVANFDELVRVFSDTDYAWMLEK